MTAAVEMPRVQECVVAACSYNHTNDCHAFAITIGSPDHAHCHTFVEMPAVRGGVDGGMTAQVGACQRADCQHNEQLECHAPSIKVGPDNDMADCMTYVSR
ncbi:DUF1540 domain-containing protein [Micromonospora sp. DSM 115977]|uniref:DUF1540 domain-containing protein n=1 Tax=Micromonospora reichwaldensis TaxID=3075516 RepID=A0ABU2WVS7_9ACTN|nr:MULTISPECIES: DUF1540 domain-containing protein [unclassified Micromonospora]KAB1153058.1 DUF1540 domain-containing protein [Micromonospora sp. AMSO12t]MDT0529982.1 DUF1540 domain-containing protein [Micromonospora sp. DSM 115977]WSG02353.1 DUF1540 domain-containing protein [Micromonospora sp. NBC_01740]